MANGNIGTLVAKLLLKTEGFDTNLRKSAAQVAALNRAGNIAGKGIGAIGGAFGKLIPAIGAAGTAIGAFKGMLDSNQELTDSWGRVVDTATNSVNQFFLAMSLGDFSGFISGLKESNQAARELYDAMDAVQTFGYYKNAAMAKEQVKFEEAQRILREASLKDAKGNYIHTDEEIIQAQRDIEKSTIAMKGIIKKGTDVLEVEYEALIKKFVAQTGATREQVMRLLTDPEYANVLREEIDYYGRLADATPQAHYSATNAYNINTAGQAQKRLNIEQEKSLNIAKRLLAVLGDGPNLEKFTQLSVELDNYKRQLNDIDYQANRSVGRSNIALLRMGDAASGGGGKKQTEYEKYETAIADYQSYVNEILDIDKQLADPNITDYLRQTLLKQKADIEKAVVEFKNKYGDIDFKINIAADIDTVATRRDLRHYEELITDLENIDYKLHVGIGSMDELKEQRDAIVVEMDELKRKYGNIDFDVELLKKQDDIQYVNELLSLYDKMNDKLLIAPELDKPQIRREMELIRDLIGSYNMIIHATIQVDEGGRFVGDGGTAEQDLKNKIDSSRYPLIVKEPTNMEPPTASDMEQWTAFNTVLYSITNAMHDFCAAANEGAAAWLSWSANLLRAIGSAIPAIAALTVAKESEAAASGKAAAAAAGASVASVPYVGPIMAVAAIASVVAALLSIPKFAGGGIVGGHSYYGDKVLAGVNSGEMILNQGQQARLFSLINNREMPINDVRFVIEGKDLVGAINNYNSKYNKAR